MTEGRAGAVLLVLGGAGLLAALWAPFRASGGGGAGQSAWVALGVLDGILAALAVLAAVAGAADLAGRRPPRAVAGLYLVALAAAGLAALARAIDPPPALGSAPELSAGAGAVAVLAAAVAIAAGLLVQDRARTQKRPGTPEERPAAELR